MMMEAEATLLAGLSAVSPQACARCSADRSRRLHQGGDGDRARQGGDVAGPKRAPTLPLLHSERYYTVGRDLVASLVPQSVLCPANSSRTPSSVSDPLPRVDTARAAAAKDAQAPATVLAAAPLAPEDAGVWTKHWGTQEQHELSEALRLLVHLPACCCRWSCWEKG